MMAPGIPLWLFVAGAMTLELIASSALEPYCSVTKLYSFWTIELLDRSQNSGIAGLEMRGQIPEKRVG